MSWPQFDSTSGQVTWDTTDGLDTLGGIAAARVSDTVTYEDGGRTLVLDVTVFEIPIAKRTHGR